ncbi:hypothetical protein BDZ89DRAFT_424690 [Hymenopellis radicata]|nr:hypothetical protein BDZ89DRAFT_424690 [Hymenopellis radicata]
MLCLSTRASPAYLSINYPMISYVKSSSLSQTSSPFKLGFSLAHLSRSNEVCQLWHNIAIREPRLYARFYLHIASRTFGGLQPTKITEEQWQAFEALFQNARAVPLLITFSIGLFPTIGPSDIHRLTQKVMGLLPHCALFTLNVHRCMVPPMLVAFSKPSVLEGLWASIIY